MKISVVIDNYNYENFIGDALQSVVEQTVVPYEVIVVDDGSTDNSREIIEKYTREYDYIKPVFQENGGQTKALNAGVMNASGDVICFLDSDDMWYRNKLEKVVNKVEKYDIVSHYLELNGEKIYRLIDCSVDWRMALLEHGYLFAHTPTSGLSFRRQLLKNFFPLENTEKIRYCTDGAILALGMFFSKTGIGFIEEPLGYYRVHGNNLFLNNTDSLDTDDGITRKREIYINNILQRKGYGKIPFEKKDYIFWCLSQKFSDGTLSLDSKCYVWGTSYSGAEVTKALNMMNIRIMGYLDSNEKKQGRYFEGKRINSPATIIECQPSKDDLIVIANCSQIELSAYLKNTMWEKNFLSLPI